MSSETTTAITTSSPIPSAGLLSPGDLDNIEKQTRAMQLVKERVNRIIIDDFNYGIDFGKSDPRAKKDSLLKPGAEKLMGDFNLSPRWKADFDSWEMLGKPAGVPCYTCELVRMDTGAVIGEGRGAGKVDAAHDQNKAIKKAEKRALVDAVLYAFGLSERFTQDMEMVSRKAEQLDAAKEKLKETVKNARMDCESSLSNGMFIKNIATDLLKGDTADTLGKVQGIEAAIVAGKYDLQTGERIP